MVKKGIIFLLTIMLLLLFFKFFVNDIEDKKVTTAIIPREKHVKQKQSKKTFDLDHVMQSQNEKQKQRKALELIRDEKEQKLSYLDAYREYVYFNTCQYTYEVNQFKAIELSKVSRFNQSISEKKTFILEPTEAQLGYLISHEEKCRALPYSNSGHFYPELLALERRYQRIRPMSKNEIELSQVIKIVKKYHQLEGQIKGDLRGRIKDQNLFFGYRKQLNDLRKELNQRHKLHASNFNSFDIKLVEKSKDTRINEIEEKISEIERLINENTSIDYNLVKQEKERLNNLHDTLVNYLKTIKSPDAFLLITETLTDNFNNKEPYVAANFYKKIQSKFQFYDKNYFQEINKVTFSLFACSLGYPCDSDSLLVETLCLDYHNKYSSQACEVNLEYYYLDYFLSQNQVDEVTAYFHYLENLNES